jgi:hypothetical protein
MESVLTMLLDGQHTVDILMDHQLKERLDKYKLLVIPEWTDLDESLKKAILQYIRNGGSVLVIGGNAVREFKPELGVTFFGAPKTIPFYIGFNDDLSGIKAPWQPVIPQPGTETIGSCYSVCDSRYPTGNPVVTITQIGKGLLAGFYVDIGNAYSTNQSPTYRKLMDKAVDRLVQLPMVSVTGSEYIHTVLSRKGSRTMVHLINTGGSHFNSKVFTYSEVPPLGPIAVRIRLDNTPSSVRLQPEGTTPEHSFHDGILTVKVQRLEIHSIVEISQ